MKIGTSNPTNEANCMMVRSCMTYIKGVPTVQDIIDKLSMLPKNTKVKNVRLVADEVQSRLYVNIDTTQPGGTLTVYPPDAETSPIVVQGKDL